ncbi:MAG: hypothetical protein NC313_09555 [Butyrivibrio sp.]|nr:hypothetical protein [Butyrivibrio sp.]
MAICGCAAKEEVPNTSGETFINETLSSVEEQTTAVNETQAAISDEIQLETNIPSEESTKTESISAPEPDNKQEMKTTQTIPAKESSSEQKTETTTTTPTEEVKCIDIAHIFNPHEQAVEISLQIPENWEYTIWDANEESSDWGYSLKVLGRNDADINILGQSGTLTADGYSNGPTSFQTSNELAGQYYWDEYMLDDKSPAIQGIIVLDTELAGFYGISFNMPKSVYSENKNIIDKVFQSIVIKESQ